MIKKFLEINNEYRMFNKLIYFIKWFAKECYKSINNTEKKLWLEVTRWLLIFRMVKLENQIYSFFFSFSKNCAHVVTLLI